jgi:4,5-dihydroxyphthalate decarboxylase
MSDTKTTDRASGTTRRSFLKTSAAVAGAAGVLGTTGITNVLAAWKKDAVKSDKLPLKVAGYKFDRVAALVDGKVQVEGCDTTFEKAAIGDINTDVFSGAQTWDVTEIGLHPFMLAYANEGFRGYSLLPVFPLRTFRHKSIFIRTDRGIKKPEDLRGKKIATPGFSSTSLTWIRGMLQHEYGVKQEDIEWIVSAKDSSADAAGKVSAQESMIPKGLNVTKGPAGQDESDLIESGYVDALFHAAEPRGFLQGDPKVGRLFSDYRIVERDYFAKTGIFPIMHAVAIRNSLVKANPWLPEAVFNAYSEAKTMMYQQLIKLGWANISLPWAAKELEETRALMGDNFWPYGIEANRKTLEALFQYSYEQGLAKKKLKMEDLFHASTLKLNE